MAFYIAPPQSMSGDDKDSFRKTYSYLYQLSEQLNYTLNNLTGENMAVQVAEAIQKADNQLNEKSTVQQQADTLKSFIVKTARTIELTMEQMEETFALNYLAKSEFGEYLQKNEMTIKTTAQGVVQSFTGYDSAESFQKEQAGFESYITETEQYIKSGYLYDETCESGWTYPVKLQSWAVPVVVSVSIIVVVFVAIVYAMAFFCDPSKREMTTYDQIK